MYCASSKSFREVSSSHSCISLTMARVFDDKTFLDAVKEGNQEAVSSYIQNHPRKWKKAKNEWEETCLHLSPDAEMTKYLISAGAVLDARASCEVTPFHSSAENGYGEVMEVLIESGCNILATGWCGKALAFASYMGQLEIVKRLLELGFHVNNKSNLLVVAAIDNGFQELRSASYGKDVLTAEETLSTTVLTIPAVHVAHDYIRIRLKHFSELARIDASVLSLLSRQKSKQNSKEMNLDSAAFKLFLERLYPSSTDLLLQGTRNKWLRRVQEAKPILDAWLALSVLDDLPERSDNCRRARVMWTKICTVRLYFEHAKPLAESEFVAKTGCTLWKIIENETPDFRNAESISLLLHFLHDTSKDCFSKMFQSTKQCFCCKKLWKNPVQLLCGHIFCLLCLTDMSGSGTNFLCPDCGKLVQNQEFQISVDLKKKVDSFVTFKRCCTSFFMELVSSYTFNAQAQKTPSSDVVRLLMTLITNGTIELGEETPKNKEFLPFVDNTPVVRSFLLQLLLRYSQEETKGLVNNYFQETQKVIECHAQGSEYIMDLRVIFVQCVEDSLDCISSGNPQHQLLLVSRELPKVLENVHAEQHSVVYLQSVASARFSLRVVADWILQQLRKPRGSPLPRERRAVFRVVEELLSDQNVPHLLFFLLKQLVRKSGTDVLSKLSHIHQFMWLEKAIRHYTDEKEEVDFDYCASIGNSYKLVREGIARSVFTASCAPLSDSVQSLPPDVKGDAKTVFILLSIYREVTMREASEDVSRHVGKEVRNVLREFCLTLPRWAENVGNQLIENSLGGIRAPKAVVVAPSQPSQMRAAAAVALHVLLAIETAHNPLTKPLIYMMKNPEMLTSSFFPTMPDDNFLAVKGAARGDIGTKWHLCPKGHPYIIDNCGKASQKGFCHCGGRIGAASFHKLAEGNVAEERVADATEKGHVLGEADARPDLVAPERDLSSASCAIIRLMMHAALMWASCDADQESLESFAHIVRPAVLGNDLPCFFLEAF